MATRNQGGTGLLLAGLALVLAGCASAPVSDTAFPGANPDIESLLSGELLFDEPVPSSEAPDSDLLEMSDEMVRFVDEQIGNNRMATVRFRRVFNGLASEGYFHSTYQAEKTSTAAETFADKAGNCLSYTNMFIALAREAGLDAHYQIVDMPPSWDATSGYLIRYTHVNVLVRGVIFDKLYGEDFSVDFNEIQPDPEYPRHAISDDEAQALFYANRSVNLFQGGEHRLAFAYLKKAIEITPGHRDLWINLGAFYAKQNVHEGAIGAYHVALDLDRRSRGAMSGLARAYYYIGETEASEHFAARVRRYRDKNPYYHFAIAQSEYEQARYAHALTAINTALELKYRNGRFHFLKGLTEQKLGAVEAARVSFKKASRFGSYRDLKQRYVEEVATTQPLG